MIEITPSDCGTLLIACVLVTQKNGRVILLKCHSPIEINAADRKVQFEDFPVKAVQKLLELGMKKGLEADRIHEAILNEHEGPTRAKRKAP